MAIGTRRLIIDDIDAAEDDVRTFRVNAAAVGITAVDCVAGDLPSGNINGGIYGAESSAIEGGVCIRNGVPRNTDIVQRQNRAFDIKAYALLIAGNGVIRQCDVLEGQGSVSDTDYGSLGGTNDIVGNRHIRKRQVDVGGDDTPAGINVQPFQIDRQIAAFCAAGHLENRNVG